MGLYGFKNTEMAGIEAPVITPAADRAVLPTPETGRRIGGDYHSPLPGTIRAKLLKDEMLLRGAARKGNIERQQRPASPRRPMAEGTAAWCLRCDRALACGGLCAGTRDADRKECWRGLDGRLAAPLDANNKMIQGQERFWEMHVDQQDIVTLIEKP